MGWGHASFGTVFWYCRGNCRDGNIQCRWHLSDPMGSPGFPWVPLGIPWVPWDPMGSPWGPHGAPMASMENPRMSKIMDFNENHYSVRQKIGDPGSKSIRNIFPLHLATSKRPESPYGAKYVFLAENPVFQFFDLLDPYWTPVLQCCT